MLVCHDVYSRLTLLLALFLAKSATNSLKKHQNYAQ
jgi:hypothetical protein